MKAAAAAAKLHPSCPTLCDPIDSSPTGSSVPGIQNTGVGCHFLLQCMKVKSENEVAQSCPTPSNPMDCSLRSSSVHGILQARVLEWVAIAFSQEMYSSNFIFFCIAIQLFQSPCLLKIFCSLFQGAYLTSINVIYAKSYFQPLSSVPLTNISPLSQHHSLKDYCFVACSNSW